MRRIAPPIPAAPATSIALAALATLASLASLITGPIAPGPLTAQTPMGGPAAAAAPGVTAIRAGALFDGTGEGMVEEVTILVRDGRIVEVGRDVPVPGDAERIDLSGWTVLPGLIDLHTHITGDHEGLSRPPGLELYTTYPEYPALQGAVNARTTLLAGFTTIRDLGAPGTTALALRDAIDRGLVTGTRMVTAIGLGTTGSHCDPTTGIRPGHVGLDDARTRVYDGPDAARAAVRAAVRDGADGYRHVAGLLRQDSPLRPRMGAGRPG